MAPPFDQGVFLLHYNRGREAFQEGRYGEARRELEAAQRLRPDDADVLNLLGLVYFKTNAFPEAEVIYRRLIGENPNVFILHSNLGLILFKQGSSMKRNSSCSAPSTSARTTRSRTSTSGCCTGRRRSSDSRWST